MAIKPTDQDRDTTDYTRMERSNYLHQRLNTIGTTLAENAKNGVDNLFVAIMEGVNSVVAADHAEMLKRMDGMQDQISAVSIQIAVVQGDVSGIALTVASCEKNINDVKQELMNLARKIEERVSGV